MRELRKLKKFSFMALVAVVLMTFSAPSALAGGGTAIVTPAGTISNPVAFLGGSIQWLQDAETTHYRIFIIGVDDHHVYHDTGVVAQDVPPGSFYGHYDIQQSIVDSLPKNMTLNLYVLTTQNGFFITGDDNSFIYIP